MALPARRARMLGSDGAIAMQERPALAFGLLAVLLGAALAVWRFRSFSRLRHGRRQLKAALDLPPLVIQLLSSPLVQSYLRRTILRAVSRKRGR